MEGLLDKVDTKAMVSGAVGCFAAMTSVMILKKMLFQPYIVSKGGNSAVKREIVRMRTGDPRSSAIVKHNGVVRISGQVGIIDKLGESDITEQTKQTLAKVDDLLAEAGTDKSRLLEARIWVLNVPEHFAKMNEVWNAWVDPENKPARFCVQSPMARPNILVEIQVVAACP